MNKSNLSGIGLNKSLMKEYSTSLGDRTVYMKNGSEFQIFLKNPYKWNLGIELKINGNHTGGMLVLKPGEKCWIERHIDDARKFVFETYVIDGNDPEMRHAISENGEIEILFYREKEMVHGYSIWMNNINPEYVDMPYSGQPVYEPMHVYCNSMDSAASSLSLNDARLSFQSSLTAGMADTVETGRVEKGRKSHQKFGYYTGDFESFPFRTEKIRIVPESMKCTADKELRRYCPGCGRKVKPKDNFCSSCGQKLD